MSASIPALHAGMTIAVCVNDEFIEALISKKHTRATKHSLIYTLKPRALRNLVVYVLFFFVCRCQLAHSTSACLSSS